MAVTLSGNILKELDLKMGDDVKVELDKEREQITIRHGKKQNQLQLNLKVKPRL